MEVFGLGVESELQVPAYTAAMAMPNPYLLSEARDQTHILMDASQVCHPLSTMGGPRMLLSASYEMPSASTFGFLLPKMHVTRASSRLRILYKAGEGGNASSLGQAAGLGALPGQAAWWTGGG